MCCCAVLSDSSRPMDCSPPSSSVDGIFQANTGVGYHFLLQGISPTQGSSLCCLCFLHWQAASFTKSKILVLMQLQVWLHSGLQDKIKIQFLIISLSFVGVLPSQISLGSKLESPALILLSSLVSSPAKRSEQLCPRILYRLLALTGHLSGPGPIIMVMGGAAELPSGSPRAAGAAEGNDEDGRGAAITAHN